MSNALSCSSGIDPRAQIEPDVEIGPFCVIGPDVRIGRGTRLENHVTITGRVTIGEHNHVYPGALIGEASGHPGRVVLGDHNVIRECVTIRLGSADSGPTTIGDHNYLMACTYVGRSCRLDDHVVVANASKLAAQVRVGRYAFLSGGVVVEPRVSIGRHGFVSIQCRIRRDVPPFMMIEGQPPRPRCVNLIGLKRHGFSATDIRALSQAHRLIYRAKLDLLQAFEVLQEAGLAVGPVGELFDFIAAQRAGVHGRARDRERC